MATKKKLLQAAAGNAGGAGLNVEDVFSTYLYTGTGSALTINNGIDLAGEGGLTWIKNRGPNAANHALYDTERGVRNFLMSSSSSAQDTASAGSGLTAFNSNGFTLGGSWVDENNNGQDAASWTFRKAPKFFDVVTYTGTGSAQNISHNLGTTVGTLIVKRTDSTGDWLVQHRSLGGTYYMDLQNQNAAATNTTYWNNTTATSTEFTVGTSSYTNASGGTYVAYLFAHNDGDGEFGSEADQDIIKCGSYTTDASADATINLGWEPQWVLFRPYDDTSNWKIVDNMRGFLATATASTGYNRELNPNTSGAELNNDGIQITSTGFDHVSGFASKNFIYIAIRRGPMAVPESATDVFDVAERGADSPPPLYRSGFVTDMFINRADVTLGGNNYVLDRLRGQVQVLMTDASDAEAAYGGAAYGFDVMDGIGNFTGLDSNNYSWMWKRAPNYFDVVAYSGNSTAGRTINHNLGVVPEMMWFKRRDSADIWTVYHSALGEGKRLKLHQTTAAEDDTSSFNNTAPTSSVFTVGSLGQINNGSGTYIAYLFASVDGVSKVGSYTGNGTSQTIDCGFSSGARFVLIKRTDSANNWFIWDTERGIVSGNDAVLQLQSTASEYSGADDIDPHSSGFIINHDNTNGQLLNGSGTKYIFYAIA